MRNLCRMAAVLSLALVATSGLALPAGAAGRKVGPQQYFTGVINGTNGNTSTPIAIRMNCGKSGQTGHPAKGQTLAVHELFPPSSSTGSLGKTGNDSKIGFFTAAPPATATRASARARRTSTAVTFTRYDKTQRLSTSLTLPCTGTGTFYFSPIPVVPPSQGATVPVEYVIPKASNRPVR